MRVYDIGNLDSWKAIAWIFQKLSSIIYEGQPENKERFTIPRYSLIIIQKLCELFHIVAFDIKALIPWHQFVYTLVIPCGRRQHSSDLYHLRSVYQQGVPSFLETGKSYTVPGPDCPEDVRRCPSGIAHAARPVSVGQYADVHCRAETKDRL